MRIRDRLGHRRRCPQRAGRRVVHRDIPRCQNLHSRGAFAIQPDRATRHHRRSGGKGNTRQADRTRVGRQPTQGHGRVRDDSTRDQPNHHRAIHGTRAWCDRLDRRVEGSRKGLHRAVLHRRQSASARRSVRQGTDRARVGARRRSGHAGQGIQDRQDGQKWTGTQGPGTPPLLGAPHRDVGCERVECDGAHARCVEARKRRSPASASPDHLHRPENGRDGR